ncbi:MAG: hypothetical protein ABI893_18735 [Polaromonas sp.]
MGFGALKPALASLGLPPVSLLMLLLGPVLAWRRKQAGLALAIGRFTPV